MKIAFICAYPAGANPGMLSVDLAVESVRKALSNNAEITLFCAEEGFNISIGPISLEYIHLQHQNQLSGFDRIVYWGDFLHWISYAKMDWLFRAKLRAPDRSEDDIINAWYKLLLLENSPELQKKVVVFGGTLYGLDGSQLADARYHSALQNLYQNARLVLMRDHLSANLIAQLAPNHVAAFGCDCALLMNSQTLLGQEVSHQQNDIQKPYMLCSFARTGSRAALFAFASNLAAKMNLGLIHFEWLGGDGQTSLIQKLVDIKHAKYLVTDIYHLSVSAWREKVPALCVGKGSSYIENTLSDKKKEIFYRQIFASDKYLYLEDVQNTLGSDKSLLDYISTCIKAIENGEANQLVFDMLDLQKEKAFARLIASLDVNNA